MWLALHHMFSPSEGTPFSSEGRAPHSHPWQLLEMVLSNLHGQWTSLLLAHYFHVSGCFVSEYKTELLSWFFDQPWVLKGPVHTVITPMFCFSVSWTGLFIPQISGRGFFRGLIKYSFQKAVYEFWANILSHLRRGIANVLISSSLKYFARIWATVESVLLSLYKGKDSQTWNMFSDT